VTGWIAISRDIHKHPIFHKRPDRLYAWTWMLAQAAWKPTRFNVAGEIVDVPRGSFCASQKTMSTGTMLTRQALRTFIKLLENQEMLSTRPAHGQHTSTTMLSICNWEKYQTVQPSTNHQSTNEQPTKEQGNNITTTIPNGIDGQAVDFTKEVFDRGVAFLSKYGVKDRQARALVAKWRKLAGDTETFNAFRDANREGVTEPVSWITARLKPSVQPDLDALMAGAIAANAEREN